MNYTYKIMHIYEREIVVQYLPPTELPNLSPVQIKLGLVQDADTTEQEIVDRILVSAPIERWEAELDSRARPRADHSVLENIVMTVDIGADIVARSVRQREIDNDAAATLPGPTMPVEV